MILSNSLFSSCPNEQERHKAMIFLNEKPVELTECNIGLCDWKVLKQKYQSFLDMDCSTAFCSVSSSGWIKGSIILIGAIQLVYLFV